MSEPPFRELAMTDLLTPHDRLFKRGFDDPEVGRAELGRLLPTDALDVLDLETLRVEPTRTIDGDLGLRDGDVVYRVDVRFDAAAEGPDAAGERGPCFVWIMLEHQSGDEPLMVLRELEYLVRRWTELVSTAQPVPKKLPVIIPVVVAHAERGWRSARRLREVYDAPPSLLRALSPMLLDFGLFVDDLTSSTDEEIEETSTSSYLTLVLWSLRSRGRVLPDRAGAWRRQFGRLYAERGVSPVEGILSYHLAVSPEDVPTAIRAAAEAHPALEETYMTLAEKLEQKGIEKGIEQGIEKGIEQGKELGARLGKLATLEKQVALKFGSTSPELAARLAALDALGLDLALERILTATTAEELFAPR